MGNPPPLDYETPEQIERDLSLLRKVIAAEMRLLTDPPPGNLEAEQFAGIRESWA